MRKKILLIYTGGTIGMKKDKEKDTLVPFNFDKLLNIVPELKINDLVLDNISIKTPVDSSNMNPEIWIEIVLIIKKYYEKYNGFVILHGTDTMAFTACALSFMLEGINKAIILTGSQIPINARRSDAKENLITSIEIANSGKVHEVCVFFEDKLYKGNRTTKVNTEDFEAFKSPNHPTLARAGVNIKYSEYLQKKKEQELIVHTKISHDVMILKLFPGISIKIIESILKNAKGIIIESFGAGNIPTNNNILKLLKKANQEGKIILNISQCLNGKVIEGKYETSLLLNSIGVLCGKDLTTEAAITKLMFLLGSELNDVEIKHQLQKNIRGEMIC